MPRYGRHKAVICLLCGKETFDTDKICDQCRRHRIIGMQVDEQRKANAGDKHPHMFPEYTLSNSFDPDPVKFNLVKFITGMTGELPASVSYREYEMPDPLALSPRIILPEWMPEDKRRGYFNNKSAWGNFNSVHFYLTDAQAGALRMLLHSMHFQMQKAKLDGERDGGHFLSRMARGELSMDDVNRWHTRIEAK